MSKIRICHDSFLESNEMNRLVEFINDDIDVLGQVLFKRYGIVRFPNDVEFLNFMLVSGSQSGTISCLNTSYAIDKNKNIIKLSPFNDYPIPNNGHSYYAIASHKYVSVEKGTVNISANGVLTGVGTKFKSVHRGQPNFPTKIKFYGTSTNTAEYQVVEVISDTQIILAGQFYPETGLRYSVIGTFTPSAYISPVDREIYMHDSCQLDIVPDTSLSSFDLSDGLHFLVARMYYSSGTLVIKDKRDDNLLMLAVDRNLSISAALNPLIGVECIKWGNVFDTNQSNEVSISWGFRFSNFIVDPTTHRMTILAGSGGKYKDPSYFVDGAFDGWRIYTVVGRYKKVISSSKSGTSINLVIDGMDPDDYPASGELLLVPDVDRMHIYAFYDRTNTPIPQIDREYTFDINTKVAKIDLLVPSNGSYLYNIQYRYEHQGVMSQFRLLPADAVGFYDETSFVNDTGSNPTPDGVLNSEPEDRVLIPYQPSLTAGYIILKVNPRSYHSVISELTTGDAFGLSNLYMDNAVPYVKLRVGYEKVYQIVHGNGVQLSTDYIIDLSKVGAVSGNSFILHFVKGENSPVVDLNGHNIVIVTDYVTPTDYTLVKKMVVDDILAVTGIEGGLRMRFIFDGELGLWRYAPINEVIAAELGSGFIDITSSIVKLTSFEAMGTAPDFTSNVWSATAAWTIDQSLSKIRYKKIGKTVTLQFKIVVKWNVHNQGGVPLGNNLETYILALGFDLPTNLKPKMNGGKVVFPVSWKNTAAYYYENPEGWMRGEIYRASSGMNGAKEVTVWFDMQQVISQSIAQDIVTCISTRTIQGIMNYIYKSSLWTNYPLRRCNSLSGFTTEGYGTVIYEID